MRKLLSFLLGIGLGTLAGMLLVTLFSPVSGNELRANLRDHYQSAVDKAKTASEKKRDELEADLQQRRDDA